MKTQINQNKITPYINVLIFITILSIPLYFFRLNILSISVSILTLNLFILSVALFAINYKSLLSTFKNNSIFWILSLLFLLSFIPALLLHPTIHGLGVFIEWITIPILASFLLATHILKHSHTQILIQNALTTTLFFVSIVSLVYLFLGQLTFDGRLNAFYPSPNHLAMFITPLIFITIATFLTSRTKYTKIFSIITLILAIIVLFYTNSFTSIISLIIALSIVIFIKSKKKIILFFVIFTAMVFIIFATYNKLSNLNQNFERNSLVSRIEIWKVASNHIQQNTLISTNGIDTFQDIYITAQPLYKPYLHWSAPTPHNLLLTLWISGGFFTILFFSLLCARWLYTTSSSYVKTKNATILLYIAAFCAILLTGFIDTPYWKNDLSIVLWILFIILNMSPKNN